jgi:hypothetical protein
MRFKRLFFIFTLLFGFGLFAHADSSKQEVIEEGYVAYATPNYFPLLEVLLDSVKAFSTRPIVVYGINADIPFSNEDYPFMIKRRMDIGELSRENIFYTKPRVILESGIRHGIYLDADNILNQGCDALFEHCKKERSYPLCPILPNDFQVDLPELMQAMSVEKQSMPYLHGHVIFTEKCLPFIAEWRESSRRYGHVSTRTHDEGILNALLWKYQVNEYVNLYDPYYALAYDYLSGGTDQHRHHGYKDWVGKIDFYLFHGCKNPQEARRVLDLLIKNF